MRVRTKADRLSWAAIFLVAAIAGCAGQGPPVRQVQTRLVDKSIFQGEWWMVSTAIHVDTDEALLFGTAGAFNPWEGAQSEGDRGIDGMNLARIRWVIDEQTLLAYRAYELVRGGNGSGDDPDFRGQPLAAFRIEQHVDVRQQYSPSTGEPTNVTYEDTADRRWYQRQFMRVDWSQNLITNFYPGPAEDAALFHLMQPESVAFQIQEGGAHPDFPASWAPQFVRVGDDPNYRFADEWPAAARDTVHYMSFVTQEVWSPGANCRPYGGLCASANVTNRHAFLRVPPEHEYASETLNHAEYDQFGIFRQTGRTYTRGGRDRETLHERCASDADCGAGGFCRTEEGAVSGVCGGGLTSDRGETDFLTFYRSRHNFYRKSFRRNDAGQTIACINDWECDGRYGDLGVVGSTCDRAAHVCTIPLPDRSGIRKVTYHLSPHFPPSYVRSAFQVVGTWNEVFMRGQRALTGSQLPSGPRIACQDQDPTQYCFCGTNATSAEVANGTCAWRYNPFLPPDRARELGVQDPYDCYVRQPIGRAASLLPHDGDAQSPDSAADYVPSEAYQHEFVGSECMFVLKANSCDRSADAACEELGDLRYQFFNYVQNGMNAFGGVAQPLANPTSGELLASPANIAGESIENVGSRYARSFELNRCRDPRADFATCERELSEEAVFGGEEVRGYFSRLGRTEYPVASAPSIGNGVEIVDPSRTGFSVDIAALTEHLDAIRPQIERFHGPTARQEIRSDRTRRLAGTALESRFLMSLGDRGREALAHQLPISASDADGALVPDLAPTDPSVIDAVSPMRDGFLDGVFAETRRQQVLASANRCVLHEPRIYDSGYTRWWAEAFRGRSRDEAALRFSQVFLRDIALHEFGHAIGLEHNFAASLDRDQYQDGYFAVARDIPLPAYESFDANADGLTIGAEATAWQEALRRAREQRMLRGVGNFSASSIMEYTGDLSGTSGLGRYDAAAVFWNYFGLTEAFVGDPRALSCRANADCGASGTCVANKCAYAGAAESIRDLRHSDRAQRAYLRYYRGGESCTADTECPYAASRVGAQPVFQRCIQNPRDTRFPTACRGARGCICSPIREDLIDYAGGTPGTPWTRPPGTPPRLTPSTYGFCSNNRLPDISWCNTFDAGESFREVVEHYRRTWRETYPAAYYRNYRNNVALGGSSTQGIQASTKFFQHFFFRYFNEPGFRSNAGPLGLRDQLYASIDAMNWFAELASLPDTGPYRLDTSAGIYRPLDRGESPASGDLTLGIGQGFPTWSQFQTGLYGFSRTERAGVFQDKYVALLALALRDWGYRFSVDQRYLINFYDFFPLEMTELFGGLIAGDARAYGPRVLGTGPTATVRYPDHLRAAGGFFRCTRAGRDVPCRASQSDTYPEPAIDTSNEVLRAWAAILSLAQFPTSNNPSFERRLSIFRLGNGDGWSLPTRREDGTPACEFGDPDHIPGCERADPENPTGYDFSRVDAIRYRSAITTTTYAAVITRPSLVTAIEDETAHVGFQLLKSLRTTQRQITALEALPSRTPDQNRDLQRLRRKLNTDESFLGFVLEVQRAYGLVQQG